MCDRQVHGDPICSTLWSANNQVSLLTIERDKLLLQIREFREECAKARLAWRDPKMDGSHAHLFVALLDKWGKGPINV